MVVPLRSAGGEGVVEPEARFRREFIGRIRVLRRPLVRRHDEVRVGSVVDHHPPGLRHFAIDDVVGDFQQPANEVPVAVQPCRKPRLALIGQALHDEGALRAAGHDDGVLHPLRLHEPEHFHPEVPVAVAPPDPAARHVVHAQVGGLRPRAAQVDLVLRLRLRNEVDGAARDLEREEGRPAQLAPVVVRAHGGVDEFHHPPQRSVVLDPAHRSQRPRELALQTPHRVGRPLLRLRIEARLEGPEDAACDPGVRRERKLAAGGGGDGADAEGVARIGPEDGYLPPCETGGHDEFVQPVIFGDSRPDGPQHVSDPVLRRRDVEVAGAPSLGLEGLDARRERLLRGVGRLVLELDREAERVEHPEPQVLERGDHVAQDVVTLAGVQPQLVVPPVHFRRGRFEQHLALARLGQPSETRHVLDRGVDVDRRLVAGRETHDMRREFVAPRRAVDGIERVLEALLPGADDRANLGLDGVEVDGPHFVRVVGQIEVEARLVALAEREVVVEERPPVSLDQRRLQPPPHLPGEMRPGEDDHELDAAAELVGARRDPHIVPASGRHDRVDDRADLLHRGEEQFLLRHRVEGPQDDVVVVRPRGRGFQLEDLAQLAAQDRDGGGVLRERLRGEQAEEPVLAVHRPVGAQTLDAHVVHADVAPNRTLGVGLGDDEKRAAQHPGAEVGGEFVQGPGFVVFRFVVVPEDPEPAPLVDADPVAAGVIRLDVVRAIAEEDEPGVHEPAKEVLDLLEFGAAPRRLDPLGLEFADERPHLLDHGGEVRGDRPHEFEALPYLGFQRLADFGVVRVVEHDVDDRHARAFGGVVADVEHAAGGVPVHHDDRVEQVRNVDPSRVEVLAQRVDDEGPVLHHRLKDAARWVVLVPAEADRDFAVGGAGEEAVEGCDIVRQRADRTSIRDVGVAAAEETAGEIADGFAGRVREARFDLADQGAEVRLLRRLVFHARRYPIVPHTVNGEGAGPRIGDPRRAALAVSSPSGRRVRSGPRGAPGRPVPACSPRG